MAFTDTTWYCNFGDGSTTGYFAVTKRPQNTAVAAGVVRRQFTAPAAGSERCFVCIVAGTTANTTDATWTLTRGAKSTDGSATWQECTGASAVNGDLTNTPTWTTVKNTAVTLGQIIQRNNGASYQICSTAGTAGNGSEPAFSDTAGTTTADNTITWTSLGVVGNFTGGGAPHARVANTLTATWFANGNTIYVGDNHAETQTGGITWTIPGGATLPAKILCHSHSGSYPPTTVTTGATVSQTDDTNMSIAPATQTTFYCYGITFKVGVGLSASFEQILLTGGSGSYAYYDNCAFWCANTAASSSAVWVLGTTSVPHTVIWNNCQVKFGNAANNIAVGTGWFIWQNTGTVLVSGSSVPTSVFSYGNQAASSTSFTILEGLDLSQLTGTLYTLNLNNELGSFIVKDCKFNASTTLSATLQVPGQFVQMGRCDSAATAYKSTKMMLEGTETTETTITRVGGATDPAGNAQSRKIVTLTNLQFYRPFRAEPYVAWNATTGANVTVTVYGTINAASVPTNGDIWIDVEYLGSSATPLGSFATSAKANLLATAASVSTDSSSWNGGGSGAGWSPFKLTVTLSSPQPGLAGYIHVKVRAAKASTTYYLEPTVYLS